MAAVIENPVLNSPFVEPTKHFRFSDDGITDEVVETRRISSYFIPIPQPKKKGPQLALPSDWNAEGIKPNDEINRIRACRWGSVWTACRPRCASATRRRDRPEPDLLVVDTSGLVHAPACWRLTRGLALAPLC